MENQLYPTIELYLRRQMPPHERRNFEAKIAADPDLAAEVAFYEALLLHHDQKVKAEWRAKGEAMLENRAQPTSSGISIIRRPQWAIAATLVLLLAATGIWYTMFYNAKPAEQALFETYYKGYHDSNNLNAQQKTAEDETWKIAFDAYKAKNYPQAIASAGSLAGSAKYGDKARLLSGSSYLEQGNTAAAVREFQQVKKSALSLYREAQFYTALAYVRANDRDKAIPALKAVKADAESPYRKKAEEILKDF